MGTKLRIIISRTDKIGDLVLSIPSFKMVRNMFPDCELMVLVRNYNYEIVKNLPYVNSVLKIDDYTEEQLRSKINDYKPDYFIALYTDSFISRLARKSKAKFRIGPFSKIHSLFSFNKGIRQKRSDSMKNEAEYNLDLIMKIDENKFVDSYEKDTEIFIDDKYKKISNSFWNKHFGLQKVISINPENGGSAKNLSSDQYKKLIALILERTNYLILITGHISEKVQIEKKYCELKSNRVKFFFNEDSVLLLAAIIEKSNLFIGSSTGPVHIAGSLQKPIIAFYSAIKTQSPTRWGVFNNNDITYFGSDFNCPEKFSCNKKCELYNCFDRIKLDDVVVEIKQKISSLVKK